MATFTPVDLSSAYTHRRNDPAPWETKTALGIAALPSGQQRFWGVPFSLGGAEASARGLVVVGANGSQVPARLPLAGTAAYLVLAHFCDARARTTVAGQSSDYPTPTVTAPGEHLADYVLEYADGSEHRVAIRRRFEVSQAISRMQNGFLCRPHHDLNVLPMRGPYPVDLWGRYQTGVSYGAAGLPPAPRNYLRARTHPGADWSIYALPNPEPHKPLRARRLWASAPSPFSRAHIIHSATSGWSRSGSACPPMPIRHRRGPRPRSTSASSPAGTRPARLTMRRSVLPSRGAARLRTSRQPISCSTSPGPETPRCASSARTSRSARSSRRARPAAPTARCASSC